MTETHLRAAASALALLAVAAPAAADVKIGMLTTLSGPGAGLGVDIRDGFALGLEKLGGKLGGQPVEVVVADDELKPEVAVQAAARLIEQDKIDILTGTVFSNVALALMPAAVRAETFYISPNAGPAQLAGAQCSPWFFNTAWQNDANHEAMGAYVESQDFDDVYLLAPNYPAGQDALTGFKRYYKGGVAGEVYTQLGQLDYAAELANLRAADPDAVYFFLPGGMGINFIKQYAQAGLKDVIPLFGPAFSFSQDILPAVGDAALGVNNTAQWSPDMDNEVNTGFVQDFQAKYDRLPSLYASQAYDTALILDAALIEAGANWTDKATLRGALEGVAMETTRGFFEFNTNHFPIQNYYLRQVVEQGNVLTNQLVTEIFSEHADAYAPECNMP